MLHRLRREFDAAGPSGAVPVRDVQRVVRSRYSASLSHVQVANLVHTAFPFVQTKKRGSSRVYVGITKRREVQEPNEAEEPKEVDGRAFSVIVRY